MQLVQRRAFLPTAPVKNQKQDRNAPDWTKVRRECNWLFPKQESRTFKLLWQVHTSALKIQRTAEQPVSHRLMSQNLSRLFPNAVHLLCQAILVTCERLAHEVHRKSGCCE